MRSIALLIANLIILLPVLCEAQDKAALRDSIARWDTLGMLNETPFADKLKYAEKSLAASQQLGSAGHEMESYAAFGSTYLNNGYFSEALSNLQKADSIAYAIDSVKRRAHFRFLMGNVHMYLRNTKKSKEHYQKALELHSMNQDSIGMGLVLNGLGIIKSEDQELDSALIYFSQSLDMFAAKQADYFKTFPLNNIGDFYLKRNQPEQALVNFDQALLIDRAFEDKKGEAIVLANVGLAHRQLKNYDQAMLNFLEGLEIAKAGNYQNVIYAIYKDIAETYQEIGRYKEGLDYYIRYHDLKDSIEGEDNQKRIAELQVLYSSERKDRRLAESREQIELLQQREKINNLWLYIIGLSSVIFLLVGGMVFVWQYVNIRKKKELIAKNEELHQTQERLMKSELEKKELSNKQLQRELEYKNKDLTNFALDIARKNEFANRVLQQLRLVEAGKREKLRELILFTSNHLKINDDLKEFQMNVEQVNHDFFDRLSKKFPDLTVNDRHLCGFIRLNLSTKDIASIRNVEPKSIEMGRYRLRKKLGLAPEDDINVFLQSV